MDHTVIYLAPPCFGDERHWCEDDAPVDCECDDGPHPWIKFAAEQVMQDLRAENDRLRAALAQSDQPCAYCSLPADEWNKCASGFPGCGRADDAMGCPELGARMELDALRAKLDMTGRWPDDTASKTQVASVFPRDDEGNY